MPRNIGKPFNGGKDKHPTQLEKQDRTHQLHDGPDGPLDADSVIAINSN